MKRLGLGAAVAAVALSGAANAADLPVAYKAPPPAPIYNWTGCYLGGGAGYGMWNQGSLVTVAGPAVTAPTTDGGNGWFGQGQVGCDYQFAAPIAHANVVTGVFADYQSGSISGQTDFPGAVGTYKETSAWAIGGRAGVLLTPRILTYLDAGYTQAHFGPVTYNLAIPGGGPTGFSLDSHTYNGWFIGSGFEYALDWLPVSGLFLKTEYRYSQYNMDSIAITGATAPAGTALQSKLSTQTVSTELVWRFNSPGHGAADAADLPVVYKAPPPAPANWTGCYLGGGGGYGMWKQDSFTTVAGAPLTAPMTNGGDGWFGQGQVGCDYQFAAPIANASVVTGAFADYEGGSISGQTDFPGVVGSYKETSAWAVGGRAGVLLTPRILTYLDAGYTQAHFGPANYNLAIAAGGPTGISLNSHTYNGWFIGSGFEYALNWLPVSGLFLKTEYRYSQYDSDSIPITTVAPGIIIPAGLALQSKPSTQMISTELVWRFNWLGH